MAANVCTVSMGDPWHSYAGGVLPYSLIPRLKVLLIPLLRVFLAQLIVSYSSITIEDSSGTPTESSGFKRMSWPSCPSEAFLVRVRQGRYIKPDLAIGSSGKSNIPGCTAKEPTRGA